MSLFKKSLIAVSVIILLIMLVKVVFKPVISNMLITAAKKYSRGQYICTLDNQGRHIGRLYKLIKGKKELIRTSTSNSCIFSKPKVNAGFFVFASGGGGGATPYEGGNHGQIISKHKYITKPVIVIKVGKGGKGTYFSEDDKFIDSKDGEDTVISDLKLTAKGGSKSTRMTPLGSAPKNEEYFIPEKYRYLYDISKSAKYGSGGQFDKHSSKYSAKAQNGQSGVVIIQW